MKASLRLTTLAAALFAVHLAQAQDVAGVARNNLRQPYLSLQGPQKDVGYDLLLEATSTPGKRYYLPHYRVRVENVGGQERYRIGIEKNGDNWMFVVDLESYPDAALGDEGRQAAPLFLNTYEFYLDFDVPVGASTVSRRLKFDQVEAQPWGVRLRLTRTSLPEKDELFSALTDAKYATHLEARLVTELGIPAQVNTEESLRMARELRQLQSMKLVQWNRDQGDSGSPDATFFLQPDGSRFSLGQVDNYRPDPTKPKEDDSFAFFLVNLVGRAEEGLISQDPRSPLAISGDRVALLNGSLALAAAANVPSSSTVSEFNGIASEAQQYALWKLQSKYFEMYGHHNDTASGPIYYGDLFLMSRPLVKGGDYIDKKNGPAFRFVEPPPSNRWYKEKERMIAEKQAQIRALKRAFSTSLFVPAPVALSESVAPTPFLFDPLRRHRYVFEQVEPPDPVSIQLKATSVAGNTYYQSTGDRSRFYYLPDRYELGKANSCQLDACPQLAVRATTDYNQYQVDYVVTPVVDPQRLQQAKAELARSEGISADSIRFEPLAGDSLSFEVALPTSKAGTAWSTQARPGAIVNLSTQISDSLTVNAEQMHELWGAFFNPDMTVFTGKVTMQMKGYRMEAIPFRGSVAPGLKKESQERIWQAVFKPDVPAQFRRNVEVKAGPQLFSSGHSFQVLFENGSVVELTENHTGGTASVAAPIGQYVLGTDTGVYRYRVTADGQPSGGWQTGQSSTLRLNSLPSQ
jgi:hypothetical protein